jgi:hypothetical protein
MPLPLRPLLLLLPFGRIRASALCCIATRYISYMLFSFFHCLNLFSFTHCVESSIYCTCVCPLSAPSTFCAAVKRIIVVHARQSVKLSSPFLLLRLPHLSNITAITPHTVICSWWRHSWACWLA